MLFHVEVRRHNMPNTTIWTGVLLILLGVSSYVGSGAQSYTALIPAAFGLILLPLGLVAKRKETARRDAMHAAAAIGLIALLGSVSGFVNLFKLLRGSEVARPAAVISQSIMFLISAVFVGLAVQSFIEARQKKKE
jgi:drug/metabolite transporter (DMT)-like permease